MNPYHPHAHLIIAWSQELRNFLGSIVPRHYRDEYGFERESLNYLVVEKLIDLFKYGRYEI